MLHHLIDPLRKASATLASRSAALSRNLVRRVNWHKAGGILMAMLPFVLLGGMAAFAAPPPVNYTTPSGGVATHVVSALEQLATTIQYILGATALVALVVAAFMNHIPNQHTKEQAKEVAIAAIVGLLIAAFGPTIINWITGLSI